MPWEDPDGADDEYPAHLEGPEAQLWRQALEDERRRLAVETLVASLGRWDLRTLKPFGSNEARW